MPSVPLGEWLPDLPDIGNEGATEARNVYPGPRGYLPFGTLAAWSTTVSGTVVGAISVRGDDGTPYTYAGTADSLYCYSATGTSTSTASTTFTRAWTHVTRGLEGADLSASGSSSGMVVLSVASDLSIFLAGETVRMYGWSASASNNKSFVVSAGGGTANRLPLVGGGASETASASVVIRLDYGLGADSRWRFARWKNLVMAFAYEAWPQYLTIGATGVFKTLTSSLRAKSVAVVRDHVVVGATYDTTDGDTPYRVRWSGSNDPTAWVVSSATLADYNDLPGSSGSVQALTGGEYGLVFCDKGVFRMTYVGAPLAFQFDEILPGIGCPASGSVAQAGDMTFFLAQDGFRAVAGGAQIVPIGHNKVDRWLAQEVDYSRYSYIQATADIVNNRILWAVTRDASATIPDTLVIYDYKLNKWSYVDVDVETLFMYWSGGMTLEELAVLWPNLELVPYSLDSRIWQQGILQPGFFTSNHCLSLHGATPMTGVVETGEAQLFADRRAHVRRLRPLVTNSTSVSVQVGSRNRQGDAYSWSATVSVNTTGDCPVRSNARYHRTRLTLGGQWQEAIGVDYDAVPEGTGR